MSSNDGTTPARRHGAFALALGAMTIVALLVHRPPQLYDLLMAAAFGLGALANLVNLWRSREH